MAPRHRATRDAFDAAASLTPSCPAMYPARPILLLALLTACSDSAMRYNPPSDRALLEAEARMGTGGAQPQSGRMTVEDILARARGESPRPATSGLTLRFAGAAVQPDTAQREQLRAFAAAQSGANLVVTGGRGDPAMLGERRAVAVARALEAAMPNVALRFATGAPTDQVQIARDAGTSLAPDGGR